MGDEGEDGAAATEEGGTAEVAAAGGDGAGSVAPASLVDEAADVAPGDALTAPEEEPALDPQEQAVTQISSGNVGGEEPPSGEADEPKVVRRRLRPTGGTQFGSVEKDPMGRKTSKEILAEFKRRRTTTVESLVAVDDAGLKAESEANKWKMPAEYFYSRDHTEHQTDIEEIALPNACAKPQRFLGFDFTRHNNLLCTTDDEVAYISGHVMCVVNTDTGEIQYIHGRDDGGIGAIDMCPEATFLAVAEKSTSVAPNIYVYVYNSMKLYRILRKGTTRGYASVKFSPHNKSHLASLGMAPDFLLSVWDWKNERLLLKCKAYGQDVFGIRWGQFPGMLTSFGIGHIRFWKMATTFTGLKLQGDLGKFGATELSDVVGFVELPDGKVVSGTEYGKLLVWEGVFVKVELMRGDGGDDIPKKIAGLPHTGAVNVVFLQTWENCLVTAGEDGFLRWWPLDEVDEAEADYDAGILEYAITMKKEVQIPPPGEEHGMPSPANILHVARNHDDSIWFIQDVRNGVVWKYEKEKGSCQVVAQAHSGPVTGTLVMQNFPGLVLSSGIDGTIRAYNMSKEQDSELFVDRRGNVGITCMTPTPAIVDPEVRTICAGYADGTIRFLSTCSDGFVLLQAHKPCTSPIRQIAYSPDGDFLAVLGADNTIFFFEVRTLDDHAVPLGFIQVPSQVNHFSWHAETGRMILSLEDGSLIELVKPMPDLIDSSETYLMSLDYRAVQPEIPEPEVPESDEDEEADGDEDEDPDAAAERREKRRQEKEEAKAAEASAAKDQDEDEEEAEPVVSAVSHAVYKSSEAGDSVLFVGTGKYSGALWECTLADTQVTYNAETPLGQHTAVPSESVMHTKLPEGVAVTHLGLLPSGRFLMVGFEDGRLWAVPTNNMSTYVSISIADSTNGRIHAISSDSEEGMLVVGAGDGNLSMVMFNSDAVVEAAELRSEDKFLSQSQIEAIEESMPTLEEVDPAIWELPETESPGHAVIARDITDPKSYSIQDQKLKSEADNAKAQAEQKKRRIRDRISDIREELEELMSKNQMMPYNRLSRADMTVDEEYVKHLEKDMERQIDDVSFELAWSVEFHERGSQKLREYYLSRLDFERIVVRGFRSPHRVSTFRCPSMSPELQSSLAKLHELIYAAERESDDGENGTAEPGSPGGHGATSNKLLQSVGRGDGEWAGGEADGTGHGGTRHISGAEHREMRRQERQQRQQQMAELEKSKPSDSYEDPQDVEAIAHAEATLGNYMLKTSDSYQVPENQRMNAEKKRRQMFLLEESMHAIKTEFNHRVLALRDFRQQVKTEVDRDLTALKEIDQQLNTSTSWVVGLLDDEPGSDPDFPERRFEFDETHLKAFGRQLKIASGEEVPQEEAEDLEDLEEVDLEEDDEDEDMEEYEDDEEGSDSGAPVAHQASTMSRRTRSSKRAADRAKAASSQPVSGRAAVAGRRIARLTLRARLLQAKGEACSNLGKAVAEEAVARLRHDKVQLEEHIKQIVETFNNAVASIEKEKAKLESDLKNADMKLLVLHEELLTLNELEEKDDSLLKKATKCRQEKTSIMHQIKECQDQLGERKAEIEGWHQEEQNLQAEFTELVGEGSPFLSALLKIYKKKVKRSKRNKKGEDDDFDEDEEDEEEDSDMGSDEDEDDDDEDVGPPPGCDVQIYDGVTDLREKRLDMEDSLQEIQKAVEELKKSHKKLLDQERSIEKEQKQTDAEIQHFQTDKQRKLNQVPIVFALRLSQVQCLEEQQQPQRLPAELDRHVVFTHEGLGRLRSRITELHQEIREVKASHKGLQKDFRLRKKEKNQRMLNIEDLQAKFQDIQMLKFGQIVDLDLIERSAPNKYVQELQEKVKEAEAEHRRRLAEWEKRIEKQKKELARITCENTSLMEQIVSMGYSQMQLDAALNARIANVTVNDTEPLIELREMERERLKDLLSLQTKEIATLQAEINLFRKKGGHIYTTVTANRIVDGQQKQR